MKETGFTDEYLKQLEELDELEDDDLYKRSFADSDMLIGFKHMHDTQGSKPESDPDLIHCCMNRIIEDDGSIEGDDGEKFDAVNVNYGKLLFFMYDDTGDEKYRKAIERLAQGVKAYMDKPVGESVSMEELYMVQPFYMEYETRYDKKEKYGDIIKLFEAAETQLESQGNPVDQLSLYMVALINTLSVMSVEIYEKYRRMQDMFKAALKKLLYFRDNEKDTFCIKGANDAVNAMTAYSILRASRQGIILKEKYAPMGMEIMEYLHHNVGRIFDEKRYEGITIAAYGEYLLFIQELKKD